MSTHLDLGPATTTKPPMARDTLSHKQLDIPREILNSTTAASQRELAERRAVLDVITRKRER